MTLGKQYRQALRDKKFEWESIQVRVERACADIAKSLEKDLEKAVENVRLNKKFDCSLTYSIPLNTAMAIHSGALTSQAPSGLFWSVDSLLCAAQKHDVRIGIEVQQAKASNCDGGARLIVRIVPEGRFGIFKVKGTTYMTP